MADGTQSAGQLFASRAAAGNAVSSTAAVIWWALKCAIAQHLIMPDEIALLALAGWFNPISLALNDWIIARLKPKGIDQI